MLVSKSRGEPLDSALLVDRRVDAFLSLLHHPNLALHPGCCNKNLNRRDWQGFGSAAPPCGS